MPHYNLPHNHGQNIERVLDNMPSAEGFQDIHERSGCVPSSAYFKEKWNYY